MKIKKDVIFDLIKIFVSILLSLFLLFGIAFYMQEIDKSNLDEIRYCPVCGSDLL